jgi:hydroxymethylglutaryl-CoA lyase
MSDLPRAIQVNEEGPREGFQIEPGPIATADKIRFIEALAETGLRKIDCVSFVNPRRVPGWADAEAVAAGIRKRPGVTYTGLWLNMAGMDRAMQTQVDLKGKLGINASATFGRHNTGRSPAETAEEQRKYLARYKALGLKVEYLTILTAFGCNFEGEIAPARVVECIAEGMALAAEFDTRIPVVNLADTVGWGTPRSMQRVIGAVRERWPGLGLRMHLHDTRGTGLANAFAAMQLGVDQFDASCAGLGGCPFAGHKGAAGNICTEDLVFMAEEMGIATGVDLDRLIDCARLAEDIVGHPLPGKVMRGGSLSKYRQAQAAQ